MRAVALDITPLCCLCVTDSSCNLPCDSPHENMVGRLTRVLVRW